MIEAARRRRPARRWISTCAAFALCAAGAAHAQPADPFAGCTPFVEALSLAEAGAPEIAIASTRQAEAEARVDEVRAAGLPQVSTYARTRAGDSGLSDSQIENQVGLRVGQRIYDFSKSRLRREAARSEVEQQDALVDEARTATRLDAAAAYIDFARSKRIEALLEEEAAFLRDLNARLSDPAVSGSVTIHELAEANAQLADTMARLSEASLQQKRIELFIRTLTGLSTFAACPATSFAPDLALSDEVFLELDTVVEQALVDNPAIRSASRALAARSAEKELQSREWMPDIELVGVLSYAYDDIRSEWDLRDRVGIDFSVPLSSGGATSARTRSAAARESQARLSRDLSRLKLGEEIRIAAQTYLAFSDQVETRTEAVRLRREQVESLDSASTSGFRSLVDLIEARRELTDQEVRLVDAEFDRLVAAAKFKYLTNPGGAAEPG